MVLSYEDQLRDEDGEPHGQPGFMLSAVSFLAGAAASWFCVCRPAWRHFIEPHARRP